MPVPLFWIESDNCSVYRDLGKSWEEHSWRSCKIPEMNIKQLTVVLPSGDSLCLGDYERYNLFVEVAQTFYGGDTKPRIEYLYMMGERKGVVTSYRVTMWKIGGSIGDITVRDYQFGKEYNGRPTAGWRKGVVV